MNVDFVVGFAKDAIQLTLLLSIPMLGVGLIVGVVISIFQAATQIQEMTLSFIPKIIAIFLALLFSFPWIMHKMMSFTQNIFHKIPEIILY